MQHARDRQREFVDHRFELRAVLGGDLEAAAHRSDCGVELAAAGVFEGLAGPEQRLLADDAEAANFLHSRVAVGDDPVARNDLRGDGADVLEGDGVGENVTLAGRIGLVGDELRNGARRDLVFLAFGHGGPDPWVSLALHTKAAREASARQAINHEEHEEHEEKQFVRRGWSPEAKERNVARGYGEGGVEVTIYVSR